MSDALFWQVLVAAEGVPYDLSRDLTSFTIEEEDRAPTMLTINVSDAYRVFSHALREGMDIEVALGTEEDHRTMFRGRIYHVDSSLPLDGTPSLTVKAYDATMLMGLQERNRRFRDVTLSQIVTEVADPHLDAPIAIDLLADPPFPGEGLRQREQTDLGFLRCLAEHMHCAMGIDLVEGAEEFVFKAHQRVLEMTSEVALHYGRCDVANRLLTFDAQVDVASIAVPRSISGMDPATGDVIDAHTTPITPVGRAEDRLLEDNLSAFEEEHPERAALLRELIAAGEALDPAVRQELGEARRDPIPAFATPEQANEEARTAQPSTSVHGMEATGSTPGNKDIHARRPMEVEGGGRFSGKWYVAKATHAFDRQGYRTEFTCNR